MVVARHGEEFQCSCSNARWTRGRRRPGGGPIARQLTAAAGSQVNELGSAHGCAGCSYAMAGNFQVMYGTPDSEVLVPGVMWDQTGKNITRDQVAPIAGTIPTVEIDRLEPMPMSLLKPAIPLLASVGNTNLGFMAIPSAPRLWMFIDPQCGFSIRAMQQLQPLVDAGKLQLAVIPLALIDNEDQGQSTRSALAMLSLPPGGYGGCVAIGKTGLGAG